MRFLLLLLSSAIFSLANEPSWLIDPSQKGKYIGSIGCAKENNDTKTQDTRALLRAKSNLSQEIDVVVKTDNHHKVTVTNELIEEEFDFDTVQTTASSFEFIVKDKYRYPNALLCIWIVKK